MQLAALERITVPVSRSDVRGRRCQATAQAQRQCQRVFGRRMDVVEEIDPPAQRQHLYPGRGKVIQIDMIEAGGGRHDPAQCGVAGMEGRVDHCGEPHEHRLRVTCGRRLGANGDGTLCAQPLQRRDGKTIGFEDQDGHVAAPARSLSMALTSSRSISVSTFTEEVAGMT